MSNLRVLPIIVRREDMYRYLGNRLILILALIATLGCAAVEPQRKEDFQSAPKVKEEDLIEDRSGGQPSQSTQNSNPYGLPGLGQPGNNSPVPPTDSTTGRSPRRFIWKDKN